MAKIPQEIGKVVAVAGAAFCGQVALGALLFAALGPVWPESASRQSVLPFLAAAQLLMVLALWAPARWSRLPKRSLFRALFLAIFGLGVFLTHVEAAVFLVMRAEQLLFGFLNGTLHALWLAWLMATAFASAPEDGTEQRSTAISSLGRRPLMLSSGVYLVLYFVAGTMIYGQIEAYYATQHIPPVGWLVALQLVRGALYVLFVSELLRSSTLGRGATSLAMASMFPILAGVAGLLVPNPLMPDAVRYWHMLEIGISNFVFGALVGYLFWSGATTKGPRQAEEAGRGLGEVEAELSCRH